MERLLTYINDHLDELTADLVPALREVDPLFRECDPKRLQPALRDSMSALVAYTARRAPEDLDASLEPLQSLWPPDRLFQSAIVRIYFGFEDLVSIRGRSVYQDMEDFIDATRAMRAAVREALCSFADRVQSRNGHWDREDDSRMTVPLTGVVESVEAQESEARRPDVDYTELAARLEPVPPVGRADEHRKLWARLRAVAARDGAHHQVIGIKAPAGYGKSTLTQSFLARVQRQLGRAPTVLTARAPRLFDLPTWPIAVLLRDALSAWPGISGNPERVAGVLETLAREQAGQAPEAAAVLRQSAPYILRLIGEEVEPDSASGLEPRTISTRLRQGLVALIEALARRARGRSGAPLFLVIEGAGEMDGPSWDLLHHVIRRVDSTAPLMVVLTYDVRYSVPALIAHLPGFSEIVLQQFDLNEGEVFIDALLQPNTLDDQTRLRLNAGAQGSPLLLYEAVRQLVEDGVLGLEGEGEDERWVEVMALPEGVVGDLAAIVARRRQRVSATAAEVLEVLAVTEDTSGGTVLEEVAARRAIARDELVAALDSLRRHGLARVTVTDEGIEARCRHPLIRDEIYRQMGLDRRRAIHEDAGEVLMRIQGTRAFPSLAASHLALAGWPTRALHGLLDGIDRCLSLNALRGALELSGQALGLLKGLAREDHDRFLYQVLHRRARIYGRLGQPELQDADLAQLEQLSRAVGTEDDRRALNRERAALAVSLGRPEEAEERLAPVMTETPTGSAPWLGVRLTLALASWQRGERGDARVLLHEAMNAVESAEAPEAISDRLRARLFETRGLFLAGEGDLHDAIRDLFQAWRVQRVSDDVHGEAMVVHALGELFWTQGRLLDALRLLRRADDLLQDADAPRARARVLCDLGDLYSLIGDFDEADRFYASTQRLVDRNRDTEVHTAAVIGQGRILVHRGQFEEAMSVLAQCIKELGRHAVREPIYVDALVALAMNFAMFARGEKLVLGGLRYAGDAADHATRIGHFAGLVQALVIQVRGLVVLNRAPEARGRLGELDEALQAALDHDPRLERMRTEVELCRYQVCSAMGEDDEAAAALDAAWSELRAQLETLRGSGYERGFLTNISQHREIVMAVGEGEVQAEP